MRTEDRYGRSLEALTSSRVCAERFSHDSDRAFLVGLKQTLQGEYFDLAIVAIESLLDCVFATEHDE